MNQTRQTAEFSNIRLILEFDGSAFSGWQVQVKGRTVQGEIERAIYEVTGEKVRVTGCSRTDAGVHAKQFVLNFPTKTKIPAERLRYPLNNKLPADIRILESTKVPLTFHARKHALAKTYVYRFINAEIEPAIGRQYISLEKGELDEAAMQAVLPLFLGRHDFKAFMSQGSPVASTLRVIYQLKLERDNNQYTLSVTGNGFLYNMVRIIVGTLFYVGHGTRTLEDVRRALTLGNRDLAGKVAQARGLMLERVIYDPADPILNLE
ncbi:MAG: tRNA pseudouridine(38-40) synthase TruA [Clostridium sp.]|nr:tRNA pseudouridine(38-40) synthase TruA [Clostridium sp.]